MDPIGIIVIVCVVLFLGTLLGVYIYKKIHHLPTGDCACCAHGKKSRLVREYHKAYCKCKQNNNNK